MKINSQLRQANIKKLLLKIRKNGPVSKRELQNQTGFSWGNISTVTTLLMNENYIITSGKEETSVGRHPEKFDINTNDNYVIGVDFNSEGILAVLCDLKGRVINEYRTELKEKNKDCALTQLFELIENILKQNKLKKVLYISLAMQGDVNTEKGISVRISAIDGWKNIEICKELEEHFGISTIILHDPDCLLYTEKYFGVLNGIDTKDALLLRIDHGIGISAMLGGKIYMGNNGKGCEIAMSVIPNNNGGWSFLKDVVKESAVEKEFLRLKNENKSCAEIALLAQNGDKTAVEIFKNLGRALSFALSGAIGLLNPEQIILFGKFTTYSCLFLPETERVLEDILGSNMPKILLSELGDNNAAVGSALFAADRVIENLKFMD